MGNSQSSQVDAAVTKTTKKADKVLKSVSAQANSTATNVSKAADKTSASVNKAAKDVKSAVNKALSSTNEDGKLLEKVALAVPVVALAVCVGVWLYKEQPWKKGKGGGAKPAGAK